MRRSQSALLIAAIFCGAYLRYEQAQRSLVDVQLQSQLLPKLEKAAAQTAVTPSPTPSPTKAKVVSTDDSIARDKLPPLVKTASNSFNPLITAKLSRRDLITKIKEKVFVHSIYMFFKWAPRGQSVWDDDLQRCLDAPEERAITKVFKRLLQDKCDQKTVVFDIGSNSGFFSILGSKFGCRVFAFDPMPSCCKQIAQNLIVNNLTSKVTIFNNFVLDSEPGKFTQIVPIDEPCFQMFEANGERHPDNYKARQETPQIPVPGIRLDDMVLEPGVKIPIVKIDVEGGDQKLLAGSFKFFQKNRIEDIIVEYGRGETKVVTATLRKMIAIGYKYLYVIGIQKWLTDEHKDKFPIEDLCSNGHSKGGDATCDAITIPVAKVQLFVEMIHACYKCRKPGTTTAVPIPVNVWFRRKPLSELAPLDVSG